MYVASLLFYWMGCQPIANPDNLKGRWITP